MVLIMKKPLETYLAFIENTLGVHLLHWQKEALRAIYNDCIPYIYGIRDGKVVMHRAAKLLKEEMDRDTGNLPPRLYELDGYSADAAMCDEDWRENIEWKKENKL